MSNKRVRVLVLGDVMLDCHLYDEQSPGGGTYERGVPIVRCPRREYQPGGAANVAANVVSLGGEVTLVGSVSLTYGWNGAGRHLARALHIARVPGQWLSEVEGFTTAIYRLRQGGRLLARWDSGYPEPSVRPLATACRLVLDHDVLVISDYGRGVLGGRYDDTPLHADLLTQLIIACATHGLPVLVDTKRTSRVTEYAGCTLLKGHVDEIRAAVPESTDQTSATRWLLEHVARTVVETYSEHGMMSMGLDEDQRIRRLIQPVVAWGDVVDPVGAGDTVLAALALRWGRVQDRDALRYAAAAAAVACSRAGTVAVTDAEAQAAMSGVIVV